MVRIVPDNKCRNWKRSLGPENTVQEEIPKSRKMLSEKNNSKGLMFLRSWPQAGVPDRESDFRGTS